MSRDHKTEALDGLRGANATVSREVRDHFLADAQVHAALYLAEQQRIANLIAVATWNEQTLNAGKARRYGVDEINEGSERTRVDRMFAEIREGIGW